MGLLKYTPLQYQLMESGGGARDVELGVLLCLSESGAGFLSVQSYTTKHSNREPRLAPKRKIIVQCPVTKEVG